MEEEKSLTEFGGEQSDRRECSKIWTKNKNVNYH